MKTRDELNKIKEEVETLNKKLHELTDEELGQVNGGQQGGFRITNEEKYKKLFDQEE